MNYDSAGNLTYDGSQAYTYDAWNRMTAVAHAYKDSGGTLHVGQTFQSDQYDGKGRRTVKAVSGTGEWDCTYVYYYDGDRQIEARDGSDETIKQQVWGVAYIDELVQVGDHNSDDDENQVNPYWVMQDANFNVLGIWDPDSGALKERYQYSPYGQRTVLTSAGSNDPILSVSSSSAPRGKDTALDYLVDPYGLCEFGHQGLMHDEESGLIYDRARYLAEMACRFAQRDPLGYADQFDLYQYERNEPNNKLDPNGTKTCLSISRYNACMSNANAHKNCDDNLANQTYKNCNDYWDNWEKDRDKECDTWAPPLAVACRQLAAKTADSFLAACRASDIAQRAVSATAWTVSDTICRSTSIVVVDDDQPCPP